MNDTSNIISLPESEKIEAEAATWLVAMEREDVSCEEKERFHQWLQQSARNQKAYDELLAMWEDMEVLKELDDIAQSVAPSPSFRAANLWWKKGAVGGVAASLFVCVAMALLLINLERLNQKDVFITAIGRQQTIELSDDSVVQLNTDSRVEIDYSRSFRKIHLVRGEAFFKVAQSKKRPFHVYAGDGVVKAIGTAFSVRLRPDRKVEVTVDEGRVALAKENFSDTKTKNTLTPSQQPTELIAGQSALFNERV